MIHHARVARPRTHNMATRLVTMPLPVPTAIPGSPFGASAAEIRAAWGVFLQQFIWEHFATLTFRFPPSVDAAVREFLVWIRRLSKYAQRPIPWFYALERGGSGWRHFHVLMAGTASLTIENMCEVWWTAAGISRIEDYDPALGAAWYVTKDISGHCEDYAVSRRMPRRLKQAGAVEQIRSHPCQACGKFAFPTQGSLCYWCRRRQSEMGLASRAHENGGLSISPLNPKN